MRRLTGHRSGNAPSAGSCLGAVPALPRRAALARPGQRGNLQYRGPGHQPAQFTQAITACRNLAPAGKVPTGAQFHAAEAGDLKTAACMRFHGIPNFPDPAVLGTGQAVGFQAGPKTGIDTRSPQFRSAWHLCQQRYPSPEFAAPAGAP